MNDRFAAQLRQHLLETADVRPADGQLARVIGGVAATTQRHRTTARLTWNPGRIGPLPSTAIRYGLIGLALVLATVAGASLAGGARQPSTVFEGTWITIDPADGSGMTLVVGPGQTPAVYFEDGYASGLACVNDAVKRFTARGTGTISANHIVVTFPEGGGCGLTTVEIRGVYDYDERGDTLSDQDGVVWTRALGERPETLIVETPAPIASPEVSTPSATPRPSPRAGDVTFTSAIHGLSIALPADWQVRPATEPWTGEALSFDSPAADIAFDPALGDDVYLIVASRPYGDLSQDAWRDGNLQWLCGEEGGSFGNVTVDDVTAFARGCGTTQSVQPFTDTRGYLIAVVGQDWDWLRTGLQTVDLRPDEAVEPSIAPPPATSGPDPTPDPDCIQFDAPGAYTAPVGSLSLTVAMPGSAAEPWNGDRDAFGVLRASCSDRSGPGAIDAGAVTMVDTNGCASGRVVAKSTAEAIAAVSVAEGIDLIEQTDVTIDGHTGARFIIRADDVFEGCPDQQLPLVDGVDPVDAGVSFVLYLIDVDGTTLALGLSGYADWDSATRTDVDAIIASMQVDP